MATQSRATFHAALAIVLVAAVVAITVVGFAHPWRPPVASVHGKTVDAVISYLLVATGVLFVGAHVVLLVFIWRFRGDGPSCYRAPSKRAEMITTLVPVVLMALLSEVGVLFIGRPVWGQVYGRPPRDALEVELCGKQFAWTARYPGPDGKFGRTDPKLIDDSENPLGIDRKDAAGADDIVVVGVLAVPANRPMYVRLRSHDVLHSFSVPQMRIKQDIVPGLVQHTRFVGDVPGTYEIGCAELCGLGHYRMKGTVKVLPPAEFDAWLASQSSWTESF